MAGKTQRLGKAAGELNVGVSTIVDFLASKGVSIDSNPNTKLDPEQYEMLRHQFAADLSLKEQSKMTAVKREKRETITLRDIKGEERQEEEEERAVEKPVVETPKVVVETPKPEVVEVPAAPMVEEKPAPVVEAPKPEPVVETPAPEPVAPAEEEKSHDNNGGIQVIGKIDLDKLNTKTRPDKRKKEDGPIDKKDYPKVATPEPVVPKPEVKAEAPATPPL
jgi:translation initiation factor IF-2